ncbi:MAG: UDP-3-O-(3-hydroxymyristoyl)glucosamine N-acyltransferase [Rickettsiaceae bacterium]|nr:UDP-3-O-(3-hydroxymyristoyl)glucosamine N-acyltransferase [Rickettsiaceae bacterium]
MHNRYFYNFSGEKSVFEVAEHIGGVIEPAQIASAKSSLIRDIKNLEDSSAGDLAFINNRKYFSLFSLAKCTACITGISDDLPENNSLIKIKVDDPYYAYSKAINLLFSEKLSKSPQNISESAKIGQNVTIGQNVVIEDGAVIGDGSYIDHNSIIKQGVEIGANCKIGAGSYISYAKIGNNTIIHPGVRIGTDGFGFATYKGFHYKILHIGKVIIGNNVEIGANTTIDRGSVRDTLIGNNVMIDNLVQIAHNVELGNGCVIVAQVGIAGSTKLGHYVVVGGQAGIAGHLNIANQVQIAAQSGVMANINEEKAIVGGSPSVPIRDWHKQTITLKNLIKQGK